MVRTIDNAGGFCMNVPSKPAGRNTYIHVIVPHSRPHNHNLSHPKTHATPPVRHLQLPVSAAGHYPAHLHLHLRARTGAFSDGQEQDGHPRTILEGRADRRAPEPICVHGVHCDGRQDHDLVILRYGAVRCWM
ncbi:hypothetical protein BC938DRAFT_474977 [Jimgerdemannia flammicorona]|uniref:Uncharacterized protein n=1 Tax=Jimgerdemannia flammicorona TaxID=994334 RepID=A0A433Q150_9FUNG|nr:hypothetical protein BC938DRAFT_474977 [Jimgerdemannia flammicorona]